MATANTSLTAVSPTFGISEECRAMMESGFVTSFVPSNGSPLLINSKLAPPSVAPTDPLAQEEIPQQEQELQRAEIDACKALQENPALPWVLLAVFVLVFMLGRGR